MFYAASTPTADAVNQPYASARAEIKITIIPIASNGEIDKAARTNNEHAGPVNLLDVGLGFTQQGNEMKGYGLIAEVPGLDLNASMKGQRAEDRG